MIIEKKPGNGEYPAVSLDSGVITVGDQSVALDDVRGDSEEIVNLKNGPAFLANIIIPPNSYELVDTGETDEDGRPLQEKQLLPLDENRLRVVIWPQKQETENQED